MIVHNAGPGERTPYDLEILVMRYMNWSWDDFVAAPQMLIEAILEQMRADNHWQGIRAKLS